MSVDWSSYARVYDLMADHNPAYQEVVRLVLGAVESAGLAPTFSAADVGAGTGNFSLAMAAAHPQAVVTHLDADPGMNAVAAHKAASRGVRNVAIVTRRADGSAFEPQTLDLCLTVHALYAMPDPAGVLRTMHGWLRPGGTLVACNLGRVLNVGDWARYYWREWRPRLGLMATAALFWRGREVARQNRLIASRQRAGSYWTHSTKGFRDALVAAGFAVESVRPCYRGYSDFAVCRKPGAEG